MSVRNGIIKRTLQPLVDERKSMRQELEALEEATAEKKSELKMVEKILRDGGLIEVEAKPEQKSKKNGHQKWSISEAMLERALDAMPDSGEEFTKRHLAEAMDSTTETAGKAIEVLRQRDLVRLTGEKVPVDTPGTNVTAAHFARLG